MKRTEEDRLDDTIKLIDIEITKLRKLAKNLLCRFFGHKWKYNFPSIPNKAMCTRCKCKALLDLEKLEWTNVDAFIDEKRTDKELARDWV